MQPEFVFVLIVFLQPEFVFYIGRAAVVAKKNSKTVVTDLTRDHLQHLKESHPKVFLTLEILSLTNLT